MLAEAWPLQHVWLLNVTVTVFLLPQSLHGLLEQARLIADWHPQHCPWGSLP